MSECEEIATTIHRLVKARDIAKAQELLELSLEDYFVLQLAMFADKDVNAYTTIAAWKQAGLRLPAENTPEFYPYGDSPSVTEEQLKPGADTWEEEKRSTPPVKTMFKNTMRWIAVLPGAFLAVVVVMFPVHWAVLLIHFFGNTGITTEQGKDILATISIETLERFGDALFVPFAFVFAGAYVAPAYKFATGIVLTILYLTGVILLLTVVAPQLGIHISETPFKMIIFCLLWIAGISCGLFQAHKADKHGRQSPRCRLDPGLGLSD